VGYMQTQRPGGGGRDDGGARHDGGGTRCSIVSGAPGHRHAADVALVSGSPCLADVSAEAASVLQARPGD